VKNEDLYIIYAELLTLSMVIFS